MTTITIPQVPIQEAPPRAEPAPTVDALYALACLLPQDHILYDGIGRCAFVQLIEYQGFPCAVVNHGEYAWFGHPDAMNMTHRIMPDEDWAAVEAMDDHAAWKCPYAGRDEARLTAGEVRAILELRFPHLAGA